ncbi:MAG: methyltransferase domain-containing protein [Gemmatimonadetes bacterium]|nr:methyltransferase domain-containing protein [Gemmatimonadota bacterium]
MTASAPSMLDLVRLSPRLLFPPGGVDLYRHIALLTDMKAGDEVLVVGCGKGVTLEYLVREHQVHGSGVDADPDLVDIAEARAREAGLGMSLQFQTGSADALPYRDGIFDVAVGELGMAAFVDPGEAVRELARVTRPGGSVVLVQLSCKGPVDESRRQVLAEHLGARPMMAVEWKRLLKSAEVEDIFTEDWSDEETAGPGAKPFFDFTEIFSLSEKAGILRRAWQRWGLKGVRTVFGREREVHRLLKRERLLRLDLLKGRRRVLEHAEDPEQASAETPGEVRVGPQASPRDPADVPGSADGNSESGTQTAGLPLFGREEEVDRRDDDNTG